MRYFYLVLVFSFFFWINMGFTQICDSKGSNFAIIPDFLGGIENISQDTLYFAPPWYSYSNNDTILAGEYTITNNTSPWLGDALEWVNTGDNNPFGDQFGYMMVVRTDTASVFWSQTTFLCDAAEYQFTFDAINLFDPNLTADVFPELELYVNGLPVQNFGPLPQDGQWQSYSAGFNSIGGGEFTIEIRNNTDDGRGNIFAIDNMVFERCGPAITLSEVNPQVHCVGDSVEVQVEIPLFATATYQWELSRDGGGTWEEIGAPTGQNTITIASMPLDGLVRVRVGETIGRLLDFTCAIISDPIGFNFRPISECFISPVSNIGDLCDAQSGENLFPAGDFGSGTNQFGPPLPDGVTTYTLQDTTWPNDGFYSILNNWDTDICDGFFSNPCWTLPLADNSDDPEGYALFVNATEGETGIFYRSTISGLCENTSYQFSADVLNLNNPVFGPNNTNNPEAVWILPNIDFIIGSVDDPLELLQVAPELYNTGDINNDNTWNTYGFTFTTGPGITEISFAMRNNAPGGGGNDLAIDNISFRMCGTAQINSPSICQGEDVTLNALINLLEFPNASIQWQQSQDRGISWQDLPGETTNALNLVSPTMGIQYRYLVAGSAQELAQVGCRLISEVDSARISPTKDTTLNLVITDGESIQIGTSIYTMSGSYTDILMASNGCDSIINTNLTVILNPVLDSIVNICEGDNFQIGDTTINQSGNYQIRIPAMNGLDSIINLNLTVLDTNFTFMPSMICSGDSITVGNFVVKEGGFYEIILTNQAGCDSIILLDLIENPVYDTLINQTICSNQPLRFGDTTLNTSGIYQRSFTTLRGCDSLVTLNLTVADVSIINLQETICEGESIFIGAQEFNTTGVFQAVLPSSNGCDSLINLDLTVLDSYTTDLKASICAGESFNVGDTSITQAGTHSILLQAANGCDSLIQLDLEVFPIFEEAINVALCEGQNYQLGDTTLSSTGSYRKMFSSVNGCDSIVRVELTVFQNYDINLDTSICEGETISFGTIVIDAPGTYTQNFQSQESCDSMVTLNVSVFPIFQEVRDIQICEGELFNGMVISRDTMIIQNFSSINNCDSVITTRIVVSPSFQEIQNISLCEGDLFEGVFIFSDTVIIKNLQTVSGCDSMISTFITVDDLSNFTILGENQICNGEVVTLSASGDFANYQWSNGAITPSISVNQEGIYDLEVITAAGCTASAAIELEELNLIPEITIENPICPGDDNGFITINAIQGGLSPYLYSLNEQPFQSAGSFLGLASGSYKLSIQETAGCTLDTTITLEEPPTFLVDIGPDLEINIGDSVQLDVQSSQAITSYTWSPEFGLSCTDCPNPLATPEASTVYTLTVLGENNCETSDEVRITVSTERNVYAPNAFSPNGDNINDYFTLFTGKGVKRIVSLNIFDRWGKLVFSQENQDPNSQLLRWDGKTNGAENAQAVYTWFAQIEFLEGIVEIFEGDVVLIK